MVLPRILNILIFMNRVISITCICQLYFMLFHVTLHRMVRLTSSRYINHLTNLHFLVACVGQPKAVFRRNLGTSLGSQNYELLDFIL